MDEDASSTATFAILSRDTLFAGDHAGGDFFRGKTPPGRDGCTGSRQIERALPLADRIDQLLVHDLLRQAKEEEPDQRSPPGGGEIEL